MRFINEELRKYFHEVRLKFGAEAEEMCKKAYLTGYNDAIGRLLEGGPCIQAELEAIGPD